MTAGLQPASARLPSAGCPAREAQQARRGAGSVYSSCPFGHHRVCSQQAPQGREGLCR